MSCDAAFSFRRGGFDPHGSTRKTTNRSAAMRAVFVFGARCESSAILEVTFELERLQSPFVPAKRTKECRRAVLRQVSRRNELDVEICSARKWSEIVRIRCDDAITIVGQQHQRRINDVVLSCAGQ